MKLDVKEIEKTMSSLRLLLYKADDQTKMSYYWDLMKECMHNNTDNINWAGEQWTLFLTQQMEDLEKRGLRIQ